MVAETPPLFEADLSFDKVAPAYRAFLEDYLRLYDLDPARFCRPLPRRDEMFFKAILPNYEQDVSIAAFKFVESTMRYYDAYRQVVEGALGGFERLGSVLDFASGWGRLTRVLEQRLRPDQIFVSDIYHDAVAWQAKTFGVTPIPSAPDPAALAYEGSHDLVFVGSMFSHLPTELFHAWLARLYRLLSPRGVLAFSVHDVGLLPADASADPSGLTYLRFSESGTLDADIYGMSYVTEAFAGAAISRLAPSPPSWRRFPKAAYENQDLYVVGAPGVDLSGLVVASTPMGGIETMTHLTNGDVELAGWAIERTPGRAIARVAAHAGGRCVFEVAPDRERPDVFSAFPNAANTPVGWTLRLPRAGIATGEMVRLQLESGSGLKGYVYAQMPPPAAMTYSGWTRRALRT